MLFLCLAAACVLFVTIIRVYLFPGWFVYNHKESGAVWLWGHPFVVLSGEPRQKGAFFLSSVLPKQGSTAQSRPRHKSCPPGNVYGERGGRAEREGGLDSV